MILAALVIALELAALLLLGGAYVRDVVGDWSKRRRQRHYAEMERLRVARERDLAEQRLQRVVGDGLTRMLREARRSDSGEASFWS